MHRNTFPTVHRIEYRNTRDLKACTYHGVLVSLGNVLHFVKAGGYSGWLWCRMIALSGLCCGFVCGSVDEPWLGSWCGFCSKPES